MTGRHAINELELINTDFPAHMGTTRRFNVAMDRLQKTLKKMIGRLSE